MGRVRPRPSGLARARPRPRSAGRRWSAAKVPLLARATPLIGHFQIRNRGTIGGSLAHADASAEYPAVALALDAVIETLSPRGQRAIPAAEFFTGIWSTALEPDELLTGVTFRAPGGRSGCAVEEFARRPGDFAVAGTAIALELDSVGGAIPTAPCPGPWCAIGLFGLGQTPLRATAAEAAVVGLPAVDASTDGFYREIGQAAMADLDSVPSDLHGPAAYRKRVGAALVARAFRQAIGEALGEEATVARGGMADVGIGVRVNGRLRRATVEPRLTLVDFLRERCQLTGTHVGCEHGVCGACTVFLRYPDDADESEPGRPDGQAVRSCLVFAVQADGGEVTTIEGVNAGEPGSGELSAVQAAFRDHHALQCGFCTPGFVISATAFLREHPDPTDEQIRDALSGNLCRCTGYQGILAAVRAAADSMLTATQETKQTQEPR